MSDIYADNLIRSLRKPAAAGDPAAQTMLAFVTEYARQQESPEPAAIADLFARLSAVWREPLPYLAGLYEVVARLHRRVNVIPALPAKREVAIAAPRYTLRDAVAGEGRLIRQSCLPKWGHVQLAVEPQRDGARVAMEWLVPESVIPKEFSPATFDGVVEAATNASVAGIRVAITGGGHHEIDSNDLSFKLAAMIAFGNAIEKAVLVPL